MLWSVDSLPDAIPEYELTPSARRADLKRGPARLMTANDAELIARIAAGDRGAFAEFYDRHSSYAFGLILRIVRRRAEAEDALQDCFFQVWSQARRYTPERGGAAVWLLLIARSRALDLLRRRRREEAAAQAATVPGVAGDTGLDAERTETAQLTSRALARLPEEQRGVIRLAFYNGMTHEEIAAAQRIPLGTVKTRIRRGMLRMRELLAPDQKAVAS